MSQSVTKVDFNKDGYADQVVTTCGEGADTSTCEFQVQMGLRDGGFVDLFKKDQLSPVPGTDLSGEWLFLSPRFFALNPKTTSIPGRPLQYTGMRWGSPNHSNDDGRIYLTEKLTDSEKKELKEAQSRGRFMIDGPAPDQKNVGIYDPQLLTLGGVSDIYAPELFGRTRFGNQLRANIFSRVLDRTSVSLDEYLYALKENQIESSVVAQVLMGNWPRFGAQIEGSVPAADFIVGQAARDPNFKIDLVARLMESLAASGFLEKNDPADRRFAVIKPATALSLILRIDPPQAKALLDDILKLHPFDLSVRNTAVEVGKRYMARRDGLEFLITAMTNRAGEPFWLGAKEVITPKELIPLIEERILKETKANSLPLMPLLMKLAEVVPALKGTVLITATRWPEKVLDLEPVRVLCRGLLGNDTMGKPPEPMDVYLRARAVAVVPYLFDLNEAAQILMGMTEDRSDEVRAYALHAAKVLKESGVPVLLALTHSSNRELKLEAFKAIAPYAVKHEGVRQRLREALNEPRFELKILAARTLVDAKDESGAEVLFEQLKRFYDEPAHTFDAGLIASRSGPTAGLDMGAMLAVEDCHRSLEQRHHMEEGLGLTVEKGGVNSEEVVSLEQLALHAVATTIGEIREAVPYLRRVVIEEEPQNEANLHAAAMGLLRMDGLSGLRTIFSRLHKTKTSKESPASLYLTVIRVVRDNRIREAFPDVYKLIFHKDGAVRQAAVEAIASIDANQLRQDLLHDAKSSDPLISDRAMGALLYLEQIAH